MFKAYNKDEVQEDLWDNEEFFKIKILKQFESIHNEVKKTESKVGKKVSNQDNDLYSISDMTGMDDKDIEDTIFILHRNNNIGCEQQVQYFKIKRTNYIKNK